MSPKRRQIRARLGRLSAIVACASVSLAPHPGWPPVDPAPVRFDFDCDSQVLEVELWSRSRAEWIPHDDHALILAGSCQIEDAGYLINEIRMRCVDSELAGRDAWITGVQVFRPGVVGECTPPGQQAPSVRITSPKPGEVIRNETQSVRVEGRVDFATTLRGQPRSSLAARLAEQEQLALPILREIRFENEHGAVSVLQLSLDSGGDFSAVVPLEPGSNRLRAIAIANNDRQGSAELDVEFDFSLIREKWLHAERARIERVRAARLRGEVDVEAEAEAEGEVKGE
jgi:hypothetical protein